MSLPKDKAWFAAKTYGYGWGLPLRWQGWVVMVGYLVAMMLGAVFLAEKSVGAFIGLAVTISAILYVICLWKGGAGGMAVGAPEEIASL
tara:strand:+ start:261 stop:527 length:267 start_codon:yes stop_codon:yes gene_type:complete